MSGKTDNQLNRISSSILFTAEMGIGPGDIRSRVDNMEWITYAMVEIATTFRPEVVKRIRPMLTRLKYGVKQELLELVSLKGIGRAKTRTLYDRGVRSKEDITRTDAGTIAAMPRIGSVLAKSLNVQTGSWNAASLYEQPEPVEVKGPETKTKVDESAPP